MKSKISYLLAIISLCFTPLCWSETRGCDQNELQKAYANAISEDQNVRKKFITALRQGLDSRDESSAEFRELILKDRENRNFLDATTDQCGWPKADVSFYGSPLEAAFLIIHHGPFAYQRKYDTRLRDAYLRGEIPFEIFDLYEKRYEASKVKVEAKFNATDAKK